MVFLCFVCLFFVVVALGVCFGCFCCRCCCYPLWVLCLFVCFLFVVCPRSLKTWKVNPFGKTDKREVYSARLCEFHSVRLFIYLLFEFSVLSFYFPGALLFCGETKVVILLITVRFRWAEIKFETYICTIGRSTVASWSVGSHSNWSCITHSYDRDRKWIITITLL